jgi:hypothetical protein
LKTPLIVILALLTIIELKELLDSPPQYFGKFDNYLDITLLALVATIVSGERCHPEVEKTTTIPLFEMSNISNVLLDMNSSIDSNPNRWLEEALDTEIFDISNTSKIFPGVNCSAWLQKTSSTQIIQLLNSSHISLGIYDTNDGETKERVDCSITRSLSAIAIVIAMFRYTMFINQFERYPTELAKTRKMFRMMFVKVLQKFWKVLMEYGFLIIAFGLGFYIILNKERRPFTDTPVSLKSKTAVKEGSCETNTENDGTDSGSDSFVSVWLGLLKTTSMFVGVVALSDISIEGSNIGMSLGYFYYLSFIFIVVLVLMNLLNALAVADITKVMQESEVECMLSNIDENNDAMKKHGNTLLRTIIEVFYNYMYIAGKLFLLLPRLLCNYKDCIKQYKDGIEKVSSTKSPVGIPVTLDRIDTGTGKLTLPGSMYWQR